MRRVAIYARYSSEHQSERSIDDQVRICRDHAERQGWTVVEVYADYALSGAHLKSRPQAQAMLAAARDGRLDVVLSEALDRLSRDQEDIAAVFKRLTFAGVSLVTTSEGEVNELHVGLKGTMNALFLADLAKKIRRGQYGRAVAGYIPGGKAYGYDVVRGSLDAKGEPIRGLRSVNDAEAGIVRRIFGEYVAGSSARTIAHGLNRDGVPSPFGGVWRASTISGNRARASGILWNEAYRGALIYNRVRMVKDPETGKRLSRANPRADWTVIDMPGLRIVDDATWNRVLARKAEFDGLAGVPRRRGAQKFVLSGLIRCGICGSNYVTHYAGRMVCGRYREARACDNARTVVMTDVAERVAVSLKRNLSQPAAMAAFVAEYRRERERLSRERARHETRDRARLREIEETSERLVDAIARGIATVAMERRLMDLEVERKRLAATIADPGPGNVIALHPNAVGEYQRAIARVVDALQADGPATSESAAEMRAVIDHIAVTPTEGRGRYELRAMTRVEALFSANRGGTSVESGGSGGGT